MHVQGGRTYGAALATRLDHGDLVWWGSSNCVVAHSGPSSTPHLAHFSPLAESFAHRVVQHALATNETSAVGRLQCMSHMAVRPWSSAPFWFRRTEKFCGQQDSRRHQKKEAKHFPIHYRCFVARRSPPTYSDLRRMLSKPSSLRPGMPRGMAMNGRQCKQTHFVKTDLPRACAHTGVLFPWGEQGAPLAHNHRRIDAKNVLKQDDIKPKSHLLGLTERPKMSYLSVTRASSAIVGRRCKCVHSKPSAHWPSDRGMNWAALFEHKTIPQACDSASIWRRPRAKSIQNNVWPSSSPRVTPLSRLITQRELACSDGKQSMQPSRKQQKSWSYALTQVRCLGVERSNSTPPLPAPKP